MVQHPDDRLKVALEAHGALLLGVRADQWTNVTPCPDWDVRQLVNHVVFGNRLFASILRGEPLAPPDERARLRDVDGLGDDPYGAYTASGEVLESALADPSVLDRVFDAPVGRMSGLAIMHLRITELLVHGWDLGRATGQPARLPEELAEDEIVFARRMFENGVPRAGRFGDPVHAPSGASALERLAAELGRTPGPGSPGAVS